MSFQLPVLFKLFPAFLTLFGQLLNLLRGPNIDGQMDLHVRFEIVFALKLCRRVADPDSTGSVDPDPYSESGSGSRRAKMTHKGRNFFEKFMF